MIIFNLQNNVNVHESGNVSGGRHISHCVFVLMRLVWAHAVLAWDDGSISSTGGLKATRAGARRDRGWSDFVNVELQRWTSQGIEPWLPYRHAAMEGTAVGAHIVPHCCSN